MKLQIQNSTNQTYSEEYAGTGASVLVHDSHIEFPAGKLEYEVPPGKYYPMIDRKSDRFILSRYNPAEHRGPFSDLDELVAELEGTVVRKDVTGKNSIKENVASIDHASMTPRYFPMEEYHVGLKQVNEGIDAFLKSKDFYYQNRLGYKRGVLLYGPPGTGKSRYVEHKCDQLITDYDAIVLRLQSYGDLDVLLSRGLYVVKAKMTNRLKVIVIEELATLVQRNDYTELLNLLDHMALQDNVLFLMTTNSPDVIPENIIDRPSRVDILEEVGNDGYIEGYTEAWYEFLMGEKMQESWKSMNFYGKIVNPSYLKELFISAKINSISIETSWKSIERRRHRIRSHFSKSDSIGF